MIPNEEIYARFLEWRRVENPCERCHGSGVRAYSSTAKWSGGIGGQIITGGVCDLCWGSGDQDYKGANLREFVKLKDKLKKLEDVAKAAKCVYDYLKIRIERGDVSLEGAAAELKDPLQKAGILEMGKVI